MTAPKAAGTAAAARPCAETRRNAQKRAETRRFAPIRSDSLQLAQIRADSAGIIFPQDLTKARLIVFHPSAGAFRTTAYSIVK